MTNQPIDDKSRTPRMDATLGKGADWIFAEGCRLERELGAKQAQLDRLMLEFCPDEMTAEQTDEWAKHQRPASAERDVESSSSVQSASPTISVVGRVSPATTAPDEPAMAKPSTVAQPLGAGSGEGRSGDDREERLPSNSAVPSSTRPHERNAMKYHAEKCRTEEGWTVEAFGEDGECHKTNFYGPEAEGRAKEYATRMNAA